MTWVFTLPMLNSLRLREARKSAVALTISIKLDIKSISFEILSATALEICLITL